MYLLAQTSGRVIIMLDGLDEFQEFEESDEGHGALLDDLRTLRRNYPHVKLVCSARPDEPFKSALRSESSLKLQDVNYADISIFASSTLAGTAASGYAHQIAESADGVFLWAHIVAHDLAKAARRGVSSTVLKERFEHCPKEMHDLFKHMIERQDSFYRSKPQPILYLFELASRTNRHGINLFDLLLLSCSDYASRTLLNLLSGTFPKKFIEDLEARADGFGDEVTERCGGLVAVNHFSFDTGTGHPDWPDDFMRWRDSKHPTLWKLMDYRVQFVHRTAHDFLREDGASFLGRHAMTLNESQGNLLLALASIGFVNLDSYCFEDIAIDLASVTARFQDFINDALQGSHCVEECCQAIDACVQRLAERLPQWSKSDDLQIRQYSCSRVKIPACPALPLEFRIALTLVGNLSQERGKIWSVYIVPRISRLSNDIRQIAAALAAMCIAVHGSGDTHERAFEILEIASPFTKLPLLMRNDAADDSGMSWRSRHSMRAEPLWQHFFSYGIFPLLSHPVLRERTRMMARSFFDQGVSEHATCIRQIWLMHLENNLIHSRSPLRISISPQREAGWSSSVIDERFKNTDTWLVEQRLDDLPLGDTWRLGGNVTKYRPYGADTWIKLTEWQAALFVLESARVYDEYSELDLVPPPRYELGALQGQSALRQACCKVVDCSLSALADDLKYMVRVEPGWGFSEGRVCHHFSDDDCERCGYSRGEDYDIRDARRAHVLRDLRSRGLILEPDSQGEQN
jgi:hypothetical protein